MQYYLFIDESGHPNLDKIEDNYPCFAACGVLVSRNNYSDIEQRIAAIKSRFWGDKTVIFRSYNIRKNRKEFEIFIGNNEMKSDFINCINNLVTESRFKIICPVIHKRDHKAKYGDKAYGAYEIAINFLLQRCIYTMCKVYTPTPKKLNIILEKRDPKLDKEIENLILSLMKYGDGFVSANEYSQYINEIKFEGKYRDIAGLQMADLMAYPIISYVQYPERENLPYKQLLSRLDHKNGIVDGFGVFRFPKT